MTTWRCTCGVTITVRRLVYPVRCACGRVDPDGSGPRSLGLGDTIARVTAALRIPHCGGCEERRKRLNELFPFGS